MTTTSRKIRNPFGRPIRTTSRRRYALVSSISGGTIEKRSDSVDTLVSEALRRGASRKADFSGPRFIKTTRWTNPRTGEVETFVKEFIVIDTFDEEAP